MDSQTAILILAGVIDGDQSDARAVVADAVWPLCETDTTGLEDWISSGDYTGNETPESIAVEWDELTQDA